MPTAVPSHSGPQSGDCGRARWWLAVALILPLALALALLAGCGTRPPQPTLAPGMPTTTPAGPSEPSGAQPTGTPSSATPEVPAGITLTVWTTEAFSPTEAITSGQILAQQVSAFESTHPGVQVRFQVKKPYGKGGILDYLLTTAAVVPDRLPDLAFIDVDELAAAVQAGLVQPLNDRLPPEIKADLYPFARDSCTFDKQLYGLQLQADLDHLVYNTDRLSRPPRTWSEVLGLSGVFLFPAGGQTSLVNDAFLIQYLAVRSLPAEGGEDLLEEGSLIATLQYYQDGMARGVFPSNISNYHSSDDCWRDYLAGQAAVSLVSAHRYLEEHHRSPSSAAAPIPGISGPAAAISRGWSLCLIALDSAHQAAAVQLMVELISPEGSSAWNQAAGYLPTRQAALAAWNEADPYRPFVEQQLTAAQPRPRLSSYTQVAAALQAAVAAVVSGEQTPEQAAAQVLSALER